MEDAFPSLHKTSYLFEIDKNNKNSIPGKKNSAAQLINDLSWRNAEFLRQFFPEMAIFTVNMWPELKEMMKENETL